MAATLTKAELEAAHCWEADDHVPRRPELTAFRRALRYHQAQWREANGHPIGSQPIVPRLTGRRDPSGADCRSTTRKRPARTSSAAGALDAARARTSFVERHQSFDHQRLWADLLSSPAFCFNLFGDLAADLRLAERALQTWFPDVPGTVREVRFAHSPGRLDPAYLGNLVAWDAAFVLDLGDGTEGILGVVTAYHDVNRRQPPKPTRLPRYREITETSSSFEPGALDAVNGTELIHIWLDHLLVLSMLQHPSRAWRWGRLVVVHPRGNTDFADACERYRDLLVDDSTFGSATVEQFLDAAPLTPKPCEPPGYASGTWPA